MTTINKFSALKNGMQRTSDLSVDTLAVSSIIIGGIPVSQTGAFASSIGTIPGTATSTSIVANWAGTTGNSIALVFNGSNTINAAISTWNLAHPTNQATLTSGDGSQIPSAQTVNLSGGINAGSSVIGDTAIYENFTPTAPTVAGVLAGIDIALSNIVSGASQKVDTFTLDSTDITNKYVTLSFTPAVADDTILLVEDAPGMFFGADFTVSGNQLSWNSLALDGILSVGDNLTVTYSI